MKPTVTRTQAAILETASGKQTTLGTLTPEERAQLRYVQQLDALKEGVHEWSPIAITKSIWCDELKTRAIDTVFLCISQRTHPSISATAILPSLQSRFDFP